MGAGTTIRIKKGYDLPLEGAPKAEIADAGASGLVTVYPGEYKGVKPRLKVAEGDKVKRGTVLFYNKKNDAMKVRSPAAGVVKSIVLGERRVIERIVIEAAGADDVESLPRFDLDGIMGLDRDKLVAHLLDTGLLSLIRQRPFSGMADPAAKPKSIFVNGMATAPFQADPNLLVRGEEMAFQAGLNALARLTAGPVFLCLDGRTQHPSAALSAAKNVQVHHFSGPHPSGNTSVHIHYLDPIEPHDVVWTTTVADTILLGKLLLDGALPASRVIALGGPGVKPDARRHYRVRIGESLSHILKDRLADGEQRIVRGDALSGMTARADESLRVSDSALFVLPEGRERFFMGWLMPGWSAFSRSPTFLSTWLRRGAKWALDTNKHGSNRAMVLTGLYDRYLPMNIMVDFLVRAILAKDTDEAIKLGILETDPEDFALCAFACPSKFDLVGIVRQGLEQIEREGI